MRTPRLRSVLIVTASLVAAGCGSSADDQAKANAATASSILQDIKDKTGASIPGGSIPDGLGGGTQKCPSKKSAVGRMRVVNIAVKDGAGAGAVDVYADGYGPDNGCQPLIKALAYGTVSDYVDVPASPYSSPPEGGLTYFDAGVTKRPTGGASAPGFWKGSTPNDGVEDPKDQETVILTGGSDTPAPTWTDVIERSIKQPEFDVKVASGKSLLMVSGSGVSSALGLSGDKSEYALSIDGKCLPADPVQGDTDPGSRGRGMLNGNATPFTVEPGTHTLGIVITAPGVGITGEDCDGVAAAVTQSVDVSAGAAMAVYLGGTSKDALSILTAPIDL